MLGRSTVKRKGTVIFILAIIFSVTFELVLHGPMEAGMVDTVQYGHIRPGMTQAEVLERLGRPDRVQETERRVYRKGRKRIVKRKRLIYQGVNPASGQKIVTTILIENGKVVDKKRSYR